MENQRYSTTQFMSSETFKVLVNILLTILCILVNEVHKALEKREKCYSISIL